MRRSVTIFLGIIYLLVMMRPILPRLLFSMNRAYIESSLCMQRDNKANTCKGACMMRKNLQQEQQGSQQLPTLLIEEVELSQLIPVMLQGPSSAVTASTETTPLQDHFGRDQHAPDSPVPPPWSSSPSPA